MSTKTVFVTFSGREAFFVSTTPKGEGTEPCDMLSSKLFRIQNKTITFDDIAAPTLPHLSLENYQSIRLLNTTRRL